MIKRPARRLTPFHVCGARGRADLPAPRLSLLSDPLDDRTRKDSFPSQIVVDWQHESGYAARLNTHGKDKRIA